jgi:hypothetical protein
MTLVLNLARNSGRLYPHGALHCRGPDADQVHTGAGCILFSAKRLQFMSEYNGLVFVGAAVPNTTFGARDPVDGAWGVRVCTLPALAVDVGYWETC